MTPVIQLTSLRRRFADTWALSGVDLEVSGPGVFGFLGVNGAGKTTTLRILAGLIAPTSGEARLFGTPVGAHNRDVLKRIGYLPQDPAFYGWMSGEETLLFAAELLGLDHRSARQRCQQLLGQLGLERAARRRVAGYSGGMRQRLGIAQALMGAPDLLLLDEPVSALDPVGRAEMLELLDELGQQHSVFMSSHILADIERVCPEIAILDQGKILVRERTTTLRARFLLPAFDVELATNRERFVALAQAADWVASVETSVGDDVTTLRVRVHDVEQGRVRLPALLVESEAALISLRPVTPTLEEVFMELVRHDGGDA